MARKEMLIDVNAVNQTYKKFPDNKTLVQLFEEQVRRTPNNIAITHGNIRLTYRELNQKSNKLANYILSQNKISPDDIIAVILERSEKTLIAIMAALKSGAAYVPIDPLYPDERIEYILEDTKSKVILVNEINKAKIQLISNKLNTSEDIHLISLDEQNTKNKIVNFSEEKPYIVTAASHLVYVIYTSGTTGKPKGVMIENRSLVNYSLSIIEKFNITKTDKCLMVSDYIFDLGNTVVYGALLSGATLHTMDKGEVLNINYVSSYIVNNEINLIKCTPLYFEQLILSDDNIFSGNNINKNTRIILGGEVITSRILNKMKHKIQNGELKLFNHYGPTETTIGAIANDDQSTMVAISGQSVPIGKPLPNYKAYILNDTLNLVKAGEIGYLYIGGVGLARGYLNLPELTAEKFIPNPLQTSEEKISGKNSRLYKTGDLVKLLKNGMIEYIGREDFQVKINGYRIELSEIEVCLDEHADVEQSVVISGQNKNGNKYLIGYYVSTSELNSDDLLMYLKSKLPPFMIPRALIRLAKIPLNANGKLDRNLLPNLEYDAKVMKNEDNTSDMESKIYNIWADILEIERENISSVNNFFDLGGTSLLLMQLKQRIEQEFKVNLAITDFFKYQSIGEFCNYLQGSDSSREIKKVSAPSKNHNTQYKKTDIAVISMSGSFSSAINIDDYWNKIINGEELITKFSNEEAKKFGILDEVYKQDNYIPVHGVVHDIDKFDSEFWKMSPKEATLCDPQIRKFLEHAWMVLEKSGYINARNTMKVAVFAGMSNTAYSDTRIKPYYDIRSHDAWEMNHLNGIEFLATRISYLLGLTGQSVSINTACSTSLVSIVEACKNLAMGDCDIALAGGVYISLPEHYGHLYQNGMVYSRDGHCKPFDQDASGIVKSDGVGIVVLKRLEEAIKDKDNIMAVVRGYAINNDGNRKMGYSAPSVAGQAECILRAQQMADITSDQISYVECHGTGTKLGDPIEVSALHEVFSSNTENGKYNCILGSVKANIGHAITASGVAGFIKVCKMLQTKTMPPQINFKEVNQHLQLENTHFRITTEQGTLEDLGKSRIAGVSSLGVGGTNAHVILEEYIPDEQINSSKKNDENNCYILPISAKSISSYQKYAITFAEYLTKNPKLDLVDVAYTLCKKREYFPYRGIIAANNIESAISTLRMISSPVHVKKAINDVIFMFPGQGNQYINMAYNLYVNEPVFATTVNQCCEFIMDAIDINFKEYIYPNAANKAALALKDTKWSQPALFIICYAMAKYLESIGIEAIAYIGHSIGEYVAATLSGVFSLSDALKVVIKRGELMQRMPNGKMISVNATFEEINGLLTEKLNISVINAPNYLVVSGTEKDIKQFAEILLQKQIPNTILHTSHAFHSPMMSGAAIEFEEYLQQVTLNKPSKPFISNVTGDFISDNDAISPNYWAKQICSTVQFSSGINALNNAYKDAICLEVGPGKSLATFIKQHGEITLSPISLLPTAKEFSNLKHIDDMQIFYSTIGKLWSFGYDLNWDKLMKIHNGSTVELPGYQFQKNRYWIDLPKITKQDFKNIPVVVEPEAMDLVLENNLLIDETVSSIEKTIALCFCEVLGINKFSKYDSYFDLGGNSLSALRLINLLNKQFKTIITMQVILQNSSVSAIARYFSNLSTVTQHKLITKLNNTTNKPILFMIHPSEAGCEVYLPLAKILEGEFSCYGIDSYNLYSDSKISDMNMLAQYYLETMITTMQECNEVNYNILGWSLGGQIALEIATILETKGIKDITLYLLDTVLNDEALKNMRDQVSLDDYTKIYMNQAITDGYDKLHIDRIVNNIDVDYKLVEQNISSQLQFAKAILFKAGNIYNRLDTQEYFKIQKHIVNLPSNNLETVFTDKNQLKVVSLNDVHHWNIIKQDHLLVPEILKFK